MQLKTKDIRQGKQNLFGFIHKSKGRLATQETTQEKLCKKAGKSIDIETKNEFEKFMNDFGMVSEHFQNDFGTINNKA